MATNHCGRVHVHRSLEIGNPSGFRAMSDRGPTPSTRSNPSHPIKPMRVVNRPSSRGPRGLFVVGTSVPATLWSTFWMCCSRTFLGFIKGPGPSPQTTPHPFPRPPDPSGTFIGWFWRWSSWPKWPGMRWHGFPCIPPLCKDFAHFPYDFDGDFGRSFETIFDLDFFDNYLKWMYLDVFCVILNFSFCAFLCVLGVTVPLEYQGDFRWELQIDGFRWDDDRDRQKKNGNVFMMDVGWRRTDWMMIGRSID